MSVLNPVKCLSSDQFWFKRNSVAYELVVCISSPKYKNEVWLPPRFMNVVQTTKLPTTFIYCIIIYRAPAGIRDLISLNQNTTSW